MPKWHVKAGEQRFRHEPLDTSASHIRLAQLLPKGEDGILSLQIWNNVLLTYPWPQYHALSHMCGPPKPQRLIKINGQMSFVRENLYLFLEALYEHHASVFDLQRFWSDALCIDDHNLEEQNHQVQQMSLVYKHAVEVLVWIGTRSWVEEYHAEETYAFNAIKQHKPQIDTSPQFEVDIPPGDLVLGGFAYHWREPFLEGWNSLCSRQYSTRT